MTIDPVVYGNLMLTAIAVILLLLLIVIIVALMRFKKTFPAAIQEISKQTNDIEEKKVKYEGEKETDPSKLYTEDSIAKNLLNLFNYYKLNSFTMATSDGLVISSTDPDPDLDAANYSYLYLKGEQPESPKIRLIGVPHKGGTVVGIIKSEEELLDNDLSLIERDLRFILRKNL